MIKSIQRFFLNIRVKYDDHPYIFITPLLFLLFAWPLYLGLRPFGGAVAYTGVLTLLLFLVYVLGFHIYRVLQAEAREQRRHTQALISLHQQINFRLPMPPVSGWTATPELLNLIYFYVRHTRPGHILELGSGLSTLICSYGCHQNDTGTVWSLDHEQAYLEKTRSLLEQHELTAYSRLVHAPLRPTKITHQTTGKSSTKQWYDLSELPDSISYDVLIVDGPPHGTNPQARYPAMEKLYARLNPGAVIIIDDTHREDEQKMISLWKNAYPGLQEDTRYGIRDGRVLVKTD
ncbi:MAG: class I SAM-dependent methyltransferase [Cyclonatronaceae bacterium]